MGSVDGCEDPVASKKAGSPLMLADGCEANHQVCCECRPQKGGREQCGGLQQALEVLHVGAGSPGWPEAERSC